MKDVAALQHKVLPEEVRLKTMHDIIRTDQILRSRIFRATMHGRTFKFCEERAV